MVSPSVGGSSSLYYPLILGVPPLLQPDLGIKREDSNFISFNVKSSSKGWPSVTKRLQVLTESDRSFYSNLKDISIGLGRLFKRFQEDFRFYECLVLENSTNNMLRK